MPPSVELYREFDHLKSPKQILERIAAGADCIDSKECLSCPLAKLKRSEDDQRWISCFEAVVGEIHDVSASEIDERYKESARRALAVFTIEELIGENTND